MSSCAGASTESNALLAARLPASLILMMFGLDSLSVLAVVVIVMDVSVFRQLFVGVAAGGITFATKSTTSSNAPLIAAMTINESGNVGIGTASQNYKLVVVSDDSSADNVAGVFKASGTHAGNGNGLFIVGNNDLSSQHFRVQHNGKVGIGTTSPAEMLHIGNPAPSGPTNLRFTWDGSQYPTNINTFHSAASGSSYCHS
jgi:hypothetical protein